MWIHRVFGAVLAALGGGVLWWLAAILYGASDPGLHTTVRVGIPGALLITLAAGFAVAIGVALMLAPRTTVGQGRRARLVGHRDRT
jgi:hypothetical protein